MNILILIINIFFSIIYSNEYIWPNEYNGNITANFSEPRPRRFHAGMDVRTFGEIGSNLYAIESGQIQRIKVLPNNYGKAIYLKLNDGNIVLYSHLNKFNEEIENLVKQLYNEYQSSFFDHTLNNNQLIKLNKGDIIGYTGDTGSLSGPHLHFEIRNKNNEPLNPLDFYKIEDVSPPIVKSLTIIPLNQNAWIDGVQDYKNIEIKKINSNKYVIQDTISVSGEFGLAVETFDKIDNLSFKYGVYKIEVLLDNALMYKIEFDNYNFSEDHLIYTAIDYSLLQEGKISHRLFKQNNSDLSFIKSNNNGRMMIDNKTHNIIINISDINNNITQIQGVLIGEFISNNVNLELNKTDKKTNITVNELNKDRIFLNIVSKYNNIENTKAKIKQISNNKFQITNYDENLDIIEFYTKNSNGAKSRKLFMPMYETDPYKINGKIIIKYIDNGIIIEFHEDEHSGYNPNLEIISSDDTIYNYLLYRKEKNILSSQLINNNDMKKISIIYNTQPEIIFNKNIFTGSPLNKNKINFNNYNIELTDDSFYNNVPIICSEENNYKLNKNFTEKSKPITIEPNNIPFKKEVKIEYDISNCNNCGFYKYSYENQKWNYLKTKNSLGTLSTQITSGGTFCILNEEQKPTIKNLNPKFNSKYKQKDFKNITFNIDDLLSGINPYSIEIKLDGKKLFYDYIKYRKLVSIDLDNPLSKGKHNIELIISDKVDNTLNLKGDFLIIE